MSCNDSFLSDHLTVSCSVHFPFKTPSPRKLIKFRPWKQLNAQTFKAKILASSIFSKPTESADEYAEELQVVLNTILDELIPEKTKLVTDRPSQPWINSDISDARQRRSQLERAWRHSKLPAGLKRFRKQSRFVRKLVNIAKSVYFSNLIKENLTSPKTLWHSFKQAIVS